MEINIDNLSKEVYEITQNCGTEPPFSGKLLNEKRKGRSEKYQNQYIQEID